MSWTDERIEELKQLWAEGHSAAEIGRRLEVSKNAVIGKAHRLALPGRPSPIKKTKPSSGNTTVKQKIDKPVLAIKPKPQAKGAKCQWPFGDPGDSDFHFCERVAIPTKPYCEEHYEMAYIKSVKSR